jgi:hypothetical protein
LAAEYPDAAWLAIPEEERFESREWHEAFFTAFDLLQFDRNITASGIELPIFYTAISRYCEDFGISGEDRRRFVLFISTLDGEYLKVQDERRQELAKRKPTDATPHENA